MTLALTLDNSFEIMNEDELYDVNGGWSITNTLKPKIKWYGITYKGKLQIHFNASEAATMLAVGFGIVTAVATLLAATVVLSPLAGAVIGMGAAFLTFVATAVALYDGASNINLTFTFINR